MTSSPRSRRRCPEAPRRSLRLGTLALAGITVATLAGCGSAVSSPASSASDSAAPVSITNCGQELVFKTTPQRVVGLMPSQTELLLRLGVGEALVGQAQTSTYDLPADLLEAGKKIPVLSTDTPPARESLLAATPDLVVSPTEYEFTAQQGFATREQLTAAGAAAYVATGGCADRRNAATVGDLLTDITNLGQIFRVPERATELSAQAQKRLDTVKSEIAGKTQPSVAQLYVEGGSLSAIGAGVEADIIKTAGGKNVFDPKAPEFASFFAATINPEEVTSRNPEVIVFAVSGPEQEKATRDYLAATFPQVSAVKENRLIAVPASDLFPGTLGNVSAVESIAAALYPRS